MDVDRPTDPMPVVTEGNAVPVADGHRRLRLVAAGAALALAVVAALALVLGVQVGHLQGQVDALRASSRLAAVERVAWDAPGTERIPLVDPTRAGPVPAPLRPPSS